MNFLLTISGCPLILRIAVAVVVEHGGYGTSATLVAGQIIQAFLIN